MPSKRFSFIADTEGWLPFSGSGDSPAHNMHYRPYLSKRKRVPANPTWIINWETQRGGTLRSTSILTSDVIGYWEWTGTWADLGATGNVSSIWVRYLWRAYFCTRIWFDALPEGIGSGPLSLTTQQGTVDLVSAAFVPAQYQSVVFPGDMPQIYVQTDPPVGWKVETGPVIALTGQQQSSPITLRLWHRIQAMPLQDDPEDLKAAFVRIAQDEIVLNWEEGSGAKMTNAPVGGYFGTQLPTTPASGYFGTHLPTAPMGGASGSRFPAAPTGGNLSRSA